MLVLNANMAAVSLFWNTNMAAVKSCENAPQADCYSKATSMTVVLIRIWYYIAQKREILNA